MLCKLLDRKSLNSSVGCICIAQQLTYTKRIDMLTKNTPGVKSEAKSEAQVT